MTVKQGKVEFFDGMRVSREHLDHLQNLLLGAAVQLRGAIGHGKIAYGLKVESKQSGQITVHPGLAFDHQARSLLLDTEKDVAVDFSGAAILYVVLVHKLEGKNTRKGVATIFTDQVEVALRTSASPYADFGVVCAVLDKIENGITVRQDGTLYLPPLAHSHSGQLYNDADGYQRYDGDRVVTKGSFFDSGYVPVAPDDSIRLSHGLATSNLLVQVQAKGADNTITSKGFGSEYWYELVDAHEIKLVRSAADTSPLLLRAMIWPVDQSGGGPVLPMAHAGADSTVEFGNSFTLDGSSSRAFGGRTVTKYTWTRMS